MSQNSIALPDIKIQENGGGGLDPQNSPAMAAPGNFIELFSAVFFHTEMFQLSVAIYNLNREA